MSNAFVMAGLPPKSQRTYSTTEQWTGEYWIDGKKIYQKTLQAQIAKKSTPIYTVIGASVDAIVKIDAIFPLPGGEYRPVPSSSTGGDFDSVSGYNNAHSIEIRKNSVMFYSASNYSFPVDAIATVYYTKTTD